MFNTKNQSAGRKEVRRQPSKHQSWILPGILGILCGPLQAATGGFYVDLGGRDRKMACEQIESAFFQFQPISDKPAECLWLSEKQSFGFHHNESKITIQLRVIQGAIYEMEYDLPRGTNTSAFSTYLAGGGLDRFSDAGATRDARMSSVAAALKERNEAEEANRMSGMPKCDWLVFTGYASAYSQDLETLAASPNPKAIANQHPLFCKSRSSGGRTTPTGGVIDRQYDTQCSGFSYFSEMKARVVGGGHGVFRVLTLMKFDDGTSEPVSVFIRSKDAKCTTTR